MGSQSRAFEASIAPLVRSCVFDVNIHCDMFREAIMQLFSFLVLLVPEYYPVVPSNKKSFIFVSLGDAFLLYCDIDGRFLMATANT